MGHLKIVKYYFTNLFFNAENIKVMTAVLPIHTVLPGLKETLATEHSALLTAPTGSGKTTVVPVALLDQEWLAGKKILLLEPRRLAVRLAASFMAGQMGEQVGETIGYRVRFDQKISKKTRVEVITEGVLTRHLQQDPELDGVGLIIFDEFHERSLEGDLALALCLDIQEGLREDLRLLIMSATLEGDTLSTLFGGAPVIRGEGKLYPVEICYLPPPADLDSSRPDHIARMTVRGVLQALKEQSGDLLVFLPGRGEIHRVMEGLAPIVADDTIVLPLYGAMTLSEQTRAVRPDPAGRRRVIVTTTIAETSLT
ncbi:MAG: DEAD/DEAH box helicase, partial [Desulfobulbaceae bacterium]|nr:DEAD/DEAH box helicase [Desulfobulbaceae bacterium]